MKRADREALRKRLCARGWPVQDWELDHIVREIDRAVSRERERALGFCHDCGGEVARGPVLCTGCFRQRQDEGMDTDDMMTIQQWRRT